MKTFVKRVAFFTLLNLIVGTEVLIGQSIKSWIYITGLRFDLSYIITVLIVSVLIALVALKMFIKLITEKSRFDESKLSVLLFGSLLGLGLSGTALAIRLKLRFY